MVSCSTLSQPLPSNDRSCHCEAPRRFFHALSRIFKVKKKLWDVPFDHGPPCSTYYISSLWMVMGLLGAHHLVISLIKDLENLVNDLRNLSSQPHPKKNLNIKHVADSNWMSMMPSARLSWRFPLTTFESIRWGCRFCLSCPVRVQPQRAKGRNRCNTVFICIWFSTYSTVI